MLKAVFQNDVDGVRAAAAAHGNIEVLDQSGRTPLLRAVAENNVKLAETLLQARANPNPAPPPGGRTAIDLALHPESDVDTAQGRLRVVSLLVAYRADLTTALRGGATPLKTVLSWKPSAALRNETAEVLRKAVEGSNTNTPQTAAHGRQKKGTLASTPPGGAVKTKEPSPSASPAPSSDSSSSSSSRGPPPRHAPAAEKRRVRAPTREPEVCSEAALVDRLESLAREGRGRPVPLFRADFRDLEELLLIARSDKTTIPRPALLRKFVAEVRGSGRLVVAPATSCHVPQMGIPAAMGYFCLPRNHSSRGEIKTQSQITIRKNPVVPVDKREAGWWVYTIDVWLARYNGIHFFPAGNEKWSTKYNIPESCILRREFADDFKNGEVMGVDPPDPQRP